MSFEATIVTDEPQTVVASSKTTFGRVPTPATPPLYGVLLIQPVQPAAVTASVPEQQTPVTVATAELPAVLPKTGSTLPWMAVLGGLALALGMTLATVRTKLTA